jgi:hypothetical protein
MTWDVGITVHLLNGCHRNEAALDIMLLRELTKSAHQLHKASKSAYQNQNSFITAINGIF